MVGDFGAQLEMIERNRSIMLREQRVPPQVFDMQAIAVYFHLGLYDRMLDHADAVISFKAANSPVWPDIFVCILTRAYIGSGDLEAAQNSLALISPDLDLNNYMMPVTPLVRQTRAELALALGNWQEARAIVEPFVKKIREDGVFGYLPEKLLLLADSLCVGGQMDAAYAALNEAYSLASEQGTMPLLWRICAQLAGMEEERGNHARANSIYGDARVAINFIAEHAGGDDLRTEFLGLPEVRSILEKTGEPT